MHTEERMHPVATRPDRLRQVATVAMVVGGVVAGAAGDYGSSQDTPNPIVPADAAFGIWFPIYGGCLAYAGYQALPGQGAREIHRHAGLPLATTVALSGTWVWLQDPPTRQLPAIAATLGSAVWSYRRAAAAQTPTDRWLLAAPSGLLAGWLTLASAVAGVEVALASGGSPPGRRATLAVLLAAGVLGTTGFPRAPRPRTYRAALAWGLAGVGAASWRRDRARALAALGAAVGAAAGATSSGR